MKSLWMKVFGAYEQFKYTSFIFLESRKEEKDMRLLRNVCLLLLEFLAKSFNISIEWWSTQNLDFCLCILTQTTFLPDLCKIWEEEVIIIWSINISMLISQKGRSNSLIFKLDSFAYSFKKKCMHLHVMVKYDSFFLVCDFCTVQHFSLAFMKLNEFSFHFPVKVLLLLPNFTLNYNGQPTGFIDQALKQFHKQQINGIVIMWGGFPY